MVMDDPDAEDENEQGYEYIDHTADIGLRAKGKDLETLFANAARGMFAILTDLETVRGTDEVDIEVEADELETLLRDFLAELLFHHEIDGIMFRSVDVEIEVEENQEGTCYQLSATAKGEPYDPDRHEYHAEIKAVTRHLLEVDPERGTATVLFDI